MLKSNFIKPQTLVNSIVDGTFQNVVGGVPLDWSAEDATNEKIGTNLFNTSLGNFSGCHLRQLGVFEIGRTYFVKVVARVLNSDCQMLSLRDGYFPFFTIEPPTQDFWYSLYGVRTATSNDFRIGHLYADAATANGKQMEIWGTAEYGVRAIDITDTPLIHRTGAQINKMFNYHFKNLIDLSNKLYRF